MQIIRARALMWLQTEFEKNYKGRAAAVEQSDAPPNAPPDAPPDGALPQHRKCRKTTVPQASLPAPNSEESEDSESTEDQGQVDELTVGLALPQIKFQIQDGASGATDSWWQAHTTDFPNVAVMARQYLGCPATSASRVERLFSQVEIAFGAKRKRPDAATMEDRMFSRISPPALRLAHGHAARGGTILGILPRGRYNSNYLTNF